MSTGTTGTTGTTINELKKKLNHHLKALHLPTMRNSYATLCELAVKESMSYEEFLLELLEKECEERWNNRIHRLLRESKLPLEKNMVNFESKRLPLFNFFSTFFQLFKLSQILQKPWKHPIINHPHEF